MVKERMPDVLSVTIESYKESPYRNFTSFTFDVTARRTTDGVRVVQLGSVVHVFRDLFIQKISVGMRVQFLI